MRRSRRIRHPVLVPVPVSVPRRGALAAAGALAVGIWLGILAGLATRPRRHQPATPPLDAG
jgi:hypothetical protein